MLLDHARGVAHAQDFTIDGEVEEGDEYRDHLIFVEGESVSAASVPPASRPRRRWHALGFPRSGPGHPYRGSMGCAPSYLLARASSCLTTPRS